MTDSEKEEAQRKAVVRASRSWLATPYRHHCCIKGPRGGVDCARFLVQGHVEAGLVEDFEIEKYTHDWHLHRSEEKYLAKVEENLKPVDVRDITLLERGKDFSVLSGNVLLWRVGRTFSHGAIVTRWPYVIHANFPDQMVTEVNVWGTVLEDKVSRVYSFWGR